MVKSDFVVENYGSIFLITPRNQEAKDWIKENVSAEGWQWMGASLTVDHRLVMNLIEGIRESGLTVS